MAKVSEILTERSKVVMRLDEIAEEEKKLRAELQAIDEAVIAGFDADGVTSVRVPELGTFVLSKRVYASILPERRTDAMALFKAHFPDLVQETVNGNTLSAFWRSAADSGQEIPKDLADCIKESVQRIVQWRRSR